MHGLLHLISHMGQLLLLLLETGHLLRDLLLLQPLGQLVLLDLEL